MGFSQVIKYRFFPIDLNEGGDPGKATSLSLPRFSHPTSDLVSATQFHPWVWSASIMSALCPISELAFYHNVFLLDRFTLRIVQVPVQPAGLG